MKRRHFLGVLGGPPVREPTRHSFGTRLINHLAEQLHGEVRMKYQPAGLVCDIDMPQAALLVRTATECARRLAAYSCRDGTYRASPAFPPQQLCTDLKQENQIVVERRNPWRFKMRVLSLALLAASAIGAVSIGSASAMPFANPASAQESFVQDVRVVCDRFGRCYNTNRARYGNRYGYRSGYRGHRAYGYNPGYRYHSGPSVGIGVGPVGIGVRAW